MKKLTQKLEDLFVNITFAEDREFASIRVASKNLQQNIEDTFTAAAFAEEGEFVAAAVQIDRGSHALRYRTGAPRRGFGKLCSSRA
ncbi:MAG TPA: hypothetical protein VN328_06560 [Thermodesulfovibrionales bacterium]|nr:hypothetical protein [Thermodesulfovibrionales bacterium]